MQIRNLGWRGLGWGRRGGGGSSLTIKGQKRMGREWEGGVRGRRERFKGRHLQGSRARHGHCRIDCEDLIKPPCHSRTRLSHRFFADVKCPCRAPL
eukprot:1184705-Prorocentrum_minimum.AAC.1